MIAALQHRHEAFVCSGVAIGAVAPLELESDLVLGAVENAVVRFFGQRLPRCGQRELEMLRQRVNLADPPVLRALFPDRDRAVLDRLRRIGNDFVFVDLEQDAQARTARAGAIRGVE